MATLPIMFDPATGVFQAIRGGSTARLCNFNGNPLFLNDATGAVRNNTAATIGNQTVSRVMSGTEGLFWALSTSLILTGANTYSGQTTISAGTLDVGAAGTVGTLGSGAVVNDATLRFNRTNALTISNAISGTGAVTKLGGATTTLTGANTYSGVTTISAGILDIGGNGTTGTPGTGEIVNNASLYFSRSNGITISNLISGTGSIRQNFGSCTLSGANTFTGGVVIGTGTLSVGTIADNGVACNLGASSSTTTFGTATLQYTGTSATTNRSFSGSGSLTETFNISSSGQTLTISGVISGGGNVAKTGAGTLELSGTNTYTGTTTVSAGALYVSGSLANTAITVANTTGARIGVGSAATKTLGGSLTMAGANAAIDVHTNGTTTASRFDVTGAFAAGGCKINILSGLDINAFTLVSAGSSSGTTPTIGTNSSGHTTGFVLASGVLTLTTS